MHEAARHWIHSVVDLVELHQTNQFDPLDDFAETAKAQNAEYAIELPAVTADGRHLVLRGKHLLERKYGDQVDEEEACDVIPSDLMSTVDDFKVLRHICSSKDDNHVDQEARIDDPANDDVWRLF